MLLDECLPGKLAVEFVEHDVLVAPTPRLDTLRPLIPRVREALQTIGAGDVVYVSA